MNDGTGAGPAGVKGLGLGLKVRVRVRVKGQEPQRSHTTTPCIRQNHVLCRRNVSALDLQVPILETALVHVFHIGVTTPRPMLAQAPVWERGRQASPP